MKLAKMPGLPRRHAPLRAHPLEYRSAAAAEGDADTALQKAAAWQWFTRGAAGADVAQAPHGEAAARHTAMKASGSSQASRFAKEAAHPSPLPHLPLFDDVELPGLASFCAGSQKKTAPYLAQKLIGQPTDSSSRPRLHFRIVDLHKLLPKRMLPRSSRHGFLGPRPSAALSDSEEAVEHPYHHYIHLHHHHHFHYLGRPADAPVEELVVTEQPHRGAAISRRRRYSESALCYEPQQDYIDDE